MTKRRSIGAGVSLVSLFIVTGLALAPAASASTTPPPVAPTIATASSDCPVGLKAIVPSQATVASRGIDALIPASASAQAIQSMKQSDVLQKAVAQNATWVTSLSCGVTDVTAGPANPPVAPSDPNKKSASSDAAATPSATAGALTSRNWSGYSLDGVDYDHRYYNQVSQTWLVPAALPAVISTQRHTSIWPGIGTGNTAFDGNPKDDALIQGGTETVAGPTGIQQTYGWFEAYPVQSTEVQIKDFPVDAKDSVGAVITVNGKNQSFYSLCDYTKNRCVGTEYDLSNNPSAVNYGGIVAQNAEWIIERTGLFNGFSELGNFGTETISSPKGSQVYGDNIRIDSFTANSIPGKGATRNSLTMQSCDGKTNLTYAPSATNVLSGGAFTVKWRNYGKLEQC